MIESWHVMVAVTDVFATLIQIKRYQIMLF